MLTRASKRIPRCEGDGARREDHHGGGRIAGCSCPDNLIPKFLGLGVQYFHNGVNRLL
jgi:hypothetical protein